MALEAGNGIAHPALSSAGWFFPLPELRFVAGSVVPGVCHSALAAARAPPVVMREDARNDTRLATIPSGPAVVGRASPWPKCFQDDYAA
jgi:hypothetical protein